MRILFSCLFITLLAASCGTGGSKKPVSKSDPTMEKNYPVKLITVDPGHFHAALVQKIMYDDVSPEVHVYAPEGYDIQQHLERIKLYNTRPVNPTAWDEKVYNGPDFFEKMLSEKAGNVVVLAGNNRKKTEYITRSVNEGFNVLSDKPMIISPEDFPALQTAFATAKEKGVLLYDIMTERFEVTTILQKFLSQKSEIFGSLVPGSKENPAVSKISVHHFSKTVSGKPLQRPAWYFDVQQQGEGIVDVTTHLVDLVQWECFPEQKLEPTDIAIVDAKRWSTAISKAEFKKVTGLDEYPDFLKKDIKDGSLNVFANGEMFYQIKGFFAKVSVEWKFEAPEGGGDTHYSVMRGTQCDLTIKQGKEEKYVPVLYVENIKGEDLTSFVTKLNTALQTTSYDSIAVEKTGNNSLRIVIPSKYRVSHEEHFGQVMKNYLEYLKAGNLPEWEVPGIITKYYTTTSALKLARSK
jgi:predicted dehydrogenase